MLDLKPVITERPGASPLPGNAADRGSGAEPALAPEVSFDRVSFRYPGPGEVPLASLESIALPAPQRATSGQDVLRDVSFTALAGRLTALVGPSGAGKTTITHLVARLYDPGAGTVRIGGTDIRDLTLASLRETVGVVTQDAHLFHDTIRANLAYARPGATDEDLTEACRAAQIHDLIAALPVFASQLNTGQTRPTIPAYTAISTALATQINAAITGTISPSAALAKAAAEGDATIAGGGH